MASIDDSRFERELGNMIPALNRFARLLCRDQESAADLAQETLAKAWKARGSFSPDTNLKAWLFAIMRNQFCSEARRGWRQVPWDQGVADAIPAPLSQQVWSAELNDAARAIGALPVRQRDALILAGVAGFSTEDAAVTLHCRTTAIKSRICRARKAVCAALEGTAKIKTSEKRQDSTSLSDILSQMEKLCSGSAEPERARVA